MSGFRDFIKMTLIGGLLVVLPIGVLVMLVARAIVTVRDMLAPAMSNLPYQALFPGLLAGVIILGVCFLTGLFIQTRPGRRVRLGIERGVLERLPGYTLLKNLGQKAIGETEGVALAPVLFETGEGLMPAYIVEEHEDGNVTVFVPSVPTPTAGQIYIAPREMVHPIDVPIAKVFRCVSKWGVGSGELLAAIRKA